MTSAKVATQLMNNNNAQNGRQQPISRLTAPPTDPRMKITASSSEQKKKPKELCRNFLWGTCTKGTECIHLHKLDLKVLKETVKFCRDFQNKVTCSRPGCTFLHVSDEEQKLFEKEGKIPRLLAERYAALKDSPTAKMVVEKSQKTGSMFNVGDYLTKPPPPPPPVASVAGPSIPVSHPSCSSLQSMLALPPPPPPPLPPLPKAPLPQPTKAVTITTTSTTAVASTSTQKLTPAKPVPNTTVSTTGLHILNQPPPPGFDASKPPPPLPQMNGAIKRPAFDSCKAGQRKMAKLDDANSLESDCNNCVQRELRIELYKQEMKDLEKEQENKSKMLKMKMVEHERAVAVLKANIDPEFYQWFDDYIEGVTTSTKAVLVELLKHVVSKGKLKNLKLTQSQYPLEDAVLTTLTRRRSSNLNDSTRLLKLLGLLASKERKPEARNTEINTEIRINASSVVKNTALMNSPVNGFVNRQKELLQLPRSRLQSNR
uniref:Masc-S n=1 Tax=Bombyx mori TaxID=7091 RepID=A0A4D6DHR1_BOMMO|nr:Masc-S [Bombyx mori]